MKSKKSLTAAVLLGLGVLLTGAQASQAEAAAVQLPVVEVVYENMDESTINEVKYLLPELKNETVNVEKLSKQIMMAKDAKAIQLSTDFKKQPDGKFKAVVTAERLKNESVTIGTSNTGNQYTGEWRANVGYTNTDVSRRGDTFGVTYATSPNHLGDVHQAAAFYKWLIPEQGGSAYISALYSDSNSDMGNIYSIGDIDLRSEGTYKDFGIHYQQNFKYTSARKQVLDVGFNYKNFDGQNDLYIGGNKFNIGDFDLTEGVVSATYYDVLRSKNQSFSYNVGVAHNMTGDSAAYTRYRGNGVQVKDNFTIFRAGVNYQYRTNSDWVFGARVNGQYTKDDLTNLEQIGAGGMNSVRGFKERIASGDNGVLGSVELYTPEFAPHQRFVLFTDMASLGNNTYRLGERSRKLSSWGVGYRFIDQDNLNISLDYAMPIDDSDIDMGKYGRRWNLNMTYRF